MTGRSHTVTVYDSDGAFMQDVADLVAAALARDEAAVIIATPEHRASLEDVLTERGHDPHAAVADGTLVLHDAATLLDEFMVDGRPDERRFAATIGAVLDAAGQRGHVHAYGEMVALLWAQGRTEAALAVEELWNQLQEERDFSLLCGYPRVLVRDASLADLAGICDRHNGYAANAWVEPATAQPADGASHSEVFLPTPQAAAQARRFVLDVLDADDAWFDAALITSELATNAIRHTKTAFRLTVSTSGRSVRIEVEDASPHLPRVAEAKTDAISGRGMAIVQRVASDWGHTDTSHGKVVWAELAG